LDWRVKHLNPRQGITTFRPVRGVVQRVIRARVKHLNPRQGITTSVEQRGDKVLAPDWCETPKSPPGDYNEVRYGRRRGGRTYECETPKSPPGDYNKICSVSLTLATYLTCETPKSPPGDYN